MAGRLGGAGRGETLVQGRIGRRGGAGSGWSGYAAVWEKRRWRTQDEELEGMMHAKWATQPRESSRWSGDPPMHASLSQLFKI